MLKLRKIVFLVHTIVALVSGAVLLIKPGGFLEWASWKPIDPIISRVLGAALLALAWSSFRGWRAIEWKQIAILVEMEAAFCILGCAGLLRHLVLGTGWVPLAWVMLGVLAAFAVAWIVCWFTKK